ncbi:MAG: pyruvate formate lyase family protein [Spirochaetota bacterium]|nr:pyruvate formate lyase family protein [Spirochaetota bacterium]
MSTRKVSEVSIKKSLEELEKDREWWWVAERSRSDRLDYLRKAIWKKGKKGGMYEPGLKVDLERPLHFTESWKENENDPIMMRRAKALSHVFDNITIFITDHAQIMGYLGSHPNTLMWYNDAASLFNEEIYNDPMIIPEPEEESLKTMSDLNNYWNTRDSMGKVLRDLSAEEAIKFMTMVLMWSAPFGGSFGYSGKDYEYIMTGKRGFEDVIDEIQDRIDEAEEVIDGNPGPDILPLYDKLSNWEAMQIILEACIRYAKRYSRLARIIAENFESDPKRKEELLQVAETCERVPGKAPKTFQDSLQFDFFIQTWARLEDLEGAWPARPDYYHWPYYNKDVNIEKNITKDEAIDLIGEFLIRAYETGHYLPQAGSEALQGVVGSWAWTLGGINVDGTDACNDLTIAFLQAARLVRVSNPTFAFRWHPQVKDEVMREVFECIRHGLGYPSIRNDPVCISNGMHWHGHPLDEMRTWVQQACMSPCPTTKHGTQPCRMAVTLNCAKMVEYALHNGFDHVVKMQVGPESGDARMFTDFEDLFQAWVKQMEWLCNFGVRIMNHGRVKSPQNYGRPFLSSITERSIDMGVDVMEPDGERGNCWMTFFTWAENADSLTAVKKLVFDEKKYTMEELVDALETNWEGKEDMRLDFVKNAPKWGNDDDYADDIMLRCLREVARHSWEIKCPSGNPWPALPENVSGNIHFANLVHALPNGRKLGDALYDGGISPGPGLDKKGPTAVLKSCGKIDHISDGRAFLLNQRLSPTQLSGEKGYQLWKSYMRTWADLGIDHVQFNMVDDATLRAAQKDPEQYQEVIVRVAGYSAHFVDISRKTQDNIIQRTIQGLG